MERILRKGEEISSLAQILRKCRIEPKQDRKCSLSGSFVGEIELQWSCSFLKVKKDDVPGLEVGEIMDNGILLEKFIVSPPNMALPAPGILRAPEGKKIY